MKSMPRQKDSSGSRLPAPQRPDFRRDCSRTSARSLFTKYITRTVCSWFSFSLLVASWGVSSSMTRSQGCL